MKLALGAERREILRGLVRIQLGRCCYCGCRMGPVHEAGEPDSPLAPTIEHVDPISKGGRDDERNRTAACSTCNELKGELDVATFLRLRFNPALLEQARQIAEGVGAMRDVRRRRAR